MPCWVEDMTLAEAAEKFDIFNSESKKPSAYDHFKVGVAYGEPHQTAIKRAFDKLGLVGAETASYGNGRPGEVAALGACKTIVTGGYRERKDLPEQERWEAASDRLVEVLEVMRQAYTTPEAHDADMIQAVARLRAQNGAMTSATRAHLVKTISSCPVSVWRSKAQTVAENSGGSQGGSVSRAIAIAGLVATEHNKSAPSQDAMLNTPSAKTESTVSAGRRPGPGRAAAVRCRPVLGVLRASSAPVAAGRSTKAEIGQYSIEWAGDACPRPTSPSPRRPVVSSGATAPAAGLREIHAAQLRVPLCRGGTSHSQRLVRRQVTARRSTPVAVSRATADSEDGDPSCRSCSWSATATPRPCTARWWCAMCATSR